MPVPATADEPGAVPVRTATATRRTIDRISEMASRYRLTLVAEVLLIVGYFGLRTADAGSVPMLAWTALTAAVALVSPTSGLVVLAAVGPWNDASRGGAPLRASLFVVIALGVGVALRRLPLAAALVGRPRHAVERLRSPWALSLLLAVALLVLTGLAVGHSYARFGRGFGDHAAAQWGFRIGGALIVLLAAYWVARRGTLRPFAVVLASAGAAVAVSLVDLWQPGVLARTALDWVVAGPPGGRRLDGVVSHPNLMAVGIVMLLAVTAAAAIFGTDRRARVAAGALTVLLLVALYLTYSRSALLALFAVAVIYAWRIRRRLAVVLVVASVVLAAVAIPIYQQIRGDTVGSGGRGAPGQALIRADQQRIRAWTAGVRIWLASPVIGSGYRSFDALERQFRERRSRPVTHAHNELLVLLDDTGVIGGALAILFVGVTVRALSAAGDPLRTASAGAFGAFCVACMFNSPISLQVSVLTFTIFGTGLAAAAARRVPARDVRPEVAPGRHTAISTPATPGSSGSGA